MTNTEKSILKTLAYYEVLGQMPLTSIEIYRHLQKENDEHSLPSFLNLISLLNKSPALKEQLDSKNGFFSLKGCNHYEQRIARQKISIAKWKKVRRLAVYLVIAPFLRGLMVSGSLAFSNTKNESDLDLLVFTKKNRIWTSRTFLSFLLQLIGQRRHGQVIKNKICLNHYVSEAQLEIPLQNLSNAHLYRHLIPLTNYNNFCCFQEQNSWIGRLIFFHPAICENHLHRINEESWFVKIGKRTGQTIEFLLSGRLGDWLEISLGRWQIDRIRQKTSHRKLDQGQLNLSDQALLFHYPVSRNNEVMNDYRQKVGALNL